MDFKRGDLIGSGNLAQRHRAWTPAAITKFLGAPDKLITNPAFRSAGKMRLYLISRVETAEATQEWEAWVATNARRSAAHTRGGPAAGQTTTVRSRTGTYRIG
ncbi:MAG TPA: hypothetical protein VF885_23780 [Arthrobacter sp.]